MNKKLARLFLAALVALPFPAFAQDHPVQITAHRGFWKSEKTKDSENSLASLRLAQKTQLWGSEFDVHLTGDNVVIVNHDNTIEGVPIHETPYQALKAYKLPNGESRPTLDQYLKKGRRSGTVLVLEIKAMETDERTILLTDLCIQKLIDHGLYDPSRVIFISFNLAACKHLAVVAPAFTTQYLSGDIDPDTLHGYGINGLDYHFLQLVKHPEWVTRAHELGMSVNCWTVNKEKDLRKMIELGVDCITTNEPLLTRELLGDREQRSR